jgi:L-aminopeptidase/D-esterase-like protein
MTITWTINNLERQTSDGLVTVVHWGATAVDGDYSASIVNTQALERGDSFVSYDTLTQETVLGWLWGKVDKATVEAALEAHIEAQKAPVTASGLPWVTE